MKKSELLELGLEDDIVKKVLALHGKSTEEKKTALATAESELTTVKEQLTEANTTIENFKEVDVEAIQQTANDYKAQFEQAQSDAAEALQKVKFDHALDNALTEAKVVNPKAVKALLNTDELILNEKGVLVGLDDQVTALKESDPNQFIPEKEQRKIIDKTKGGGGGGGDALTNALRDGANLPPLE